MAKKTKIKLEEFVGLDVVVTTPLAAEWEAKISGGQTPEVLVDSKARPITEAGKAMLGGYWLVHRSVEFEVPCLQESPMDTMDRKRAEEKEISEKFTRWGIENVTLTLVQVSPRKYAVIEVPKFYHRISTYPGSRAFAKGEIVVQPTDYDTCVDYLKSNGQAIPEGL